MNVVALVVQDDTKALSIRQQNTPLGAQYLFVAPMFHRSAILVSSRPHVQSEIVRENKHEMQRPFCLFIVAGTERVPSCVLFSAFIPSVPW